MRELILIRTHFFCEATERLYHYLRQTSNRDVAFICDETNGVVDVGAGKAKIAVSARSVAEMGLHVPKNFGWLCGDYFLYAAAGLLGAYDRYWLIESDVRIGLESSADFFDRFDDGSVDILAFHVFRAKDNWFWYKPMCFFEPEVHACLFPVVGASRRAIDFAYAARRTMSATHDRIVPPEETRRWPNDESFLMSTLMANGFRCANLDDMEVKYRTRQSFNFGLPKSDKRIGAQHPSGLFHHPVHSGERFVSKANAWLTTCIRNKATKTGLAGAFDELFMSDMRAEASGAQYAAFEARLLAAISDAPA